MAGGRGGAPHAIGLSRRPPFSGTNCCRVVPNRCPLSASAVEPGWRRLVSL